MFTGIIILFVTIQGVSFSGGAQIKPKGTDRIHYPGPVQEVPLTRYGASNEDVPEECRDKTYCTIKPPNYPQEKFNKLFKNVRPIEQASLVLSNIGDRQGDPEEVDNCETIVSYDTIYKVKSQSGEWRVVVQAPEKNYVQKVRLESCEAPNAQCFEIYLGLPGYTTYCRQQYTTWKFIVEAKEGPEQTEKISVDLPTCCSCRYKEIDSKK